nr:DUF3267 domain-containing protein [Natronorubrum halophilum]
MPVSDTVPQSPPQLIATFRRTRSVAFQWVVVSVVGFFASAYAFGHVLAAIRGGSLEPIVITILGPTDAVVWLVVSVGVVALVVILHELLHGVFMARYGGDPGYGIGVSYFLLPYAYAETAGTSYTRNQLLVALLAPFVGITAVGLAALVVYPSALLLVPLAANAAGSIGDLWMAGVLLQYPADVRVGALPDAETQGFGIYSTTDGGCSRIPGTQLFSTVISGAVGTLAILSIAVLGMVFLSLAVGSGTVVLGDPAGRWFLFRHELRSYGQVHLEIGTPLVVGLTALGGITWALGREGYRALGLE